MINFENKDKAAVITKEKSYSYSELLSLIDSYSKLFSNQDFERIAIYSENRIDWIAAFYAGWRNNCEVVPIDYLASTEDISFIINDCKPDLIFISPELKRKVDEISSQLTFTPNISYLGDLELPQPGQNLEWEQAKDLDKTAVIIYTSGTTGSPKGVMLSYKNLIANIRGVSKEVEIYNSERQVLMLLPLHHIFPLAGTMIIPLYVGSTIAMSPSMQSNDLLETLRNNQVAIMIGVPRLYELIYKGVWAKISSSFVAKTLYKLVKSLKSKKLALKIFKKVHVNFGGHLKFLVSGGAALPTHIGELFQTLGFDVLEGFGMTEAAPMITFTRPGKVRIGSPGQALPSIQMEIRDDEIVAKGENIMKGYLNSPKETSEVLKDGWLYTGDLGRIDKDGYLFITGRKKDIIILSNGKNINPVEVETKFEKTHSSVKEAGVFLHNNQLHIAILPDFEALFEQNVADIDDYFKHQIIPAFNDKQSSYKRIMKFAIVNSELPRTRLGKIQRFKLADHAKNATAKSGTFNFKETIYYLSVKNYIESQIDFDVKPNHHIEFDIGLDSLTKMGLANHIEKTFGVKMDEKRLITFPTLSDMADYINEKKQWFRQETTSWAETLKEKVDIKLPKSWFTHNFFKNTAKFSFKLYFRFRGEGMDNIPDGPCIIAPNHQSFIDGLFVASFLKRKVFKQTYFYAKKKHVNNRFLRFLARTNNVIVMDIEGELKESIQKMAAALKEGKKVIIFPEGTRTTNGKLGEFKKTFAILSTELNVPVVPVAIIGADRALPVGARIPRPWVKVRVKFLEPILPEGRTPEALTEDVYNEIKHVLA
ncbi:MAG TPA: long-chain fatty acid--CoA ligase [Bacteroidales bacterium]|nr:long-chain fatty acid--CoA ligase [Bacteroidales bacterium]